MVIVKTTRAPDCKQKNVIFSPSVGSTWKIVAFMSTKDKITCSDNNSVGLFLNSEHSSGVFLSLGKGFGKTDPIDLLMSCCPFA